MRGKSFKTRRARTVWLVLPLLCSVTLVNAAEIKVASGRGFSSVLDVLAGEFEHTTGNKVVITYGPGHAIRDKIRNGDATDVVIIPRPLVEELANENKVSAGTMVNIAHSDVAMGVRAGAPKPDIGSRDAFKRWLLGIKTIVCSDPKIGATTSAYFTRALDRLGIVDQVKPKIRFVSDRHTADYVARGEAEIAVQLANELLAVPGIEAIPLPPEFQTRDFVFTAGIATASKEGAAAKSFIQFLAAPAVIPVIKAKHLDPG
jgi:molybdate transport system substrate-binding protein